MRANTDRRADKITMLPSQGFSARLAKAVLPSLKNDASEQTAKLPRQRGRVVHLMRAVKSDQYDYQCPRCHSGRWTRTNTPKKSND